MIISSFIMITINKAKEIAKYVSDFASSRFEDIDIFYRTTHRDRHYGIYQLKHGPALMDFLISIHGNMEEKLNFPCLLPTVFASPNQLMEYLLWLRKYIVSHQDYINDNISGDNTSYIIVELSHISNDIISMIDYVKQWYDADDDNIPYLEMRFCLNSQNIGKFIAYLQKIFASISYAINKTSEGAYHSNLHIILKLLGFDIISEDETNAGRIDAVIKLSDIIYIVEIKKADRKDDSDIALQQIIDNKYPQKYMYDGYNVVALGISFCTKERNINGYKSTVIYTKDSSL